MFNNDIIISESISMMDALKIMDQTERKLLVVCSNDIFIGVISIGDIQRALLNKKDLDQPVKNFVRSDITYALDSDDEQEILTIMRKERIEAMPVVNRENRLIRIIEWKDVFNEEPNFSKLNIPVVVMAGGKGKRLLPLTNIIPKPLVPISDKTVIEEIMTKFRKAGCEKFILSVNYMFDIIYNYFSQKKEWNIEYIKEEKPLGTAGSLYLLRDKVDSTFFVTNCDIIADVKFNELIDYHEASHNIITIVSVLRSLKIPYGTLETAEDGMIVGMKEKPEFLYQINSGLYVLEPDVFNYITDNEFLNITDLIVRVMEDGKKVGAFPISEGSWVDMGNWNEYLKLVNLYNNKIGFE